MTSRIQKKTPTGGEERSKIMCEELQAFLDSVTVNQQEE